MISQCFTNIDVKIKDFPAPFTSFCTVSYVDSACLTLIFIYSPRRQSGTPFVSAAWHLIELEPTVGSKQNDAFAGLPLCQS